MSLNLVVVAVWLSALSGSATAGAQDASLEQTYTSMCAGKPAPETEVCAALKKALVAKLSDQSNPPIATSIPSSASLRMPETRVLSTMEIRRRWGMYAHLAGKRYFLNWMGSPSINSFFWEVPGEVLVSRTDGATKTGAVKNDPCCPSLITKYRWDAGRNAIVTEGVGGGGTMRPAADGSFHQPPEQKGKYGVFRSRTWLNSDGSWTSVNEKLRNGIWNEKYRFNYYEMTPQFLASLSASSSGNGDLLGVLQGAIAGASGMVSGGGGMDAAIAGAAAGAVAGAAGVDSSSIQSGFQQGASEVNASNAEMQRSFDRSMERAGAPGYERSGGSSTAGLGSAGTSSSTGVNSATQVSAASTYHWYCYGQKKAPDPGKSDRIVSIYLGTVTSSRQDINAATELFRRHTSSDRASGTESPGAWCAPANSNVEANERLDFYRSRDARWPQMNVNLVM